MPGGFYESYTPAYLFYVARQELKLLDLLKESRTYRVCQNNRKILLILRIHNNFKLPNIVWKFKINLNGTATV